MSDITHTYIYIHNWSNLLKTKQVEFVDRRYTHTTSRRIYTRDQLFSRSSRRGSRGSHPSHSLSLSPGDQTPTNCRPRATHVRGDTNARAFARKSHSINTIHSRAFNAPDMHTHTRGPRNFRNISARSPRYNGAGGTP